MPIIKSAIKRVRQTAKRRERNVALKRDIKSAVKAFQDKPSAKTLSAAQSEIDTAVKKNLLNKRTAARRKSALARVAKEAGVKLETTKKKPAAKTTTKPAAKPAAAKKAPAKKPAASTAKKPATKSATTAKTAAKKPTAKKATK